MPRVICHLDLADADATARLGQAFADRLDAGDVLLLDGQIGAGKTHFARALIAARLARLGRHEDIPSPTFTLVQTYDADVEIWHADLYRLTHPDEVIELGLDEAFETAICLVEWPDRLAELVPEGALRLSFSLAAGGASRVVEISGGPDWDPRLAGICP
ncbi:tRNA (adenosine(37)-N6)-threonylcarbamoyltransferase complex ATPase subunit type 1 TsaE [Pseudothioclava arenosa]|uniref:tRNA threonylcarbamoyladenosine biosynthesis protein TsaE n=1 Tax=Pseudothioclava arenosa TaxID=1795308 RepID=A0A2A4CKQ6_9RHOB|nr:tRNA (adenosine(37)-N6)-threonylcarbamoyltransferase complex ATPase subunit type 1 TsaE [Pseudothioclava arenosa]PCD76603.1 tRNA (adenosine(37)-N6)-threonylcarbamoyltransferase complex ATPase subunit type 1 TsaE [Pseudothioclava arenosa]